VVTPPAKQCSHTNWKRIGGIYNWIEISRNSSRRQDDTYAANGGALTGGVAYPGTGTSRSKLVSEATPEWIFIANSFLKGVDDR